MNFPQKYEFASYFCSPFFEIQQFTTYFEQNSLNYWIVDMCAPYPKEKSPDLTWMIQTNK